MKQTVSLHAPFNLRTQNSFFGGWPILADTDDIYSIVMAFPVESTNQSAAVVLSQMADGQVTAEAHAASDIHELAIRQALAALSLDVDDSKWVALGRQDAFIAELQTKYDYLRPILFHSPYEAAASFVLGQRISIKQRQALQAKLSEAYGEKIEVEDQSFNAFPTPGALLKVEVFSSLNQTKIERLHGIAQAALEGKLDRQHLLGLPIEEALAELQGLPGIGPFYASGILYRGAGIVDGITDDSLTKYAVQQAYKLKQEPTQTEVLEIAEQWHPYQMWCEVLIHVWLRREVGLPKRH